MTGNTRNSYSTGFILWIIYYCYSTFIAIMFQKVILPLVPSMHAGKGLIRGGDSVLFHSIAMKLAESIRLMGWEQWTLRPAEGSTGNVSLLSIFYVLFGNEPSLIVPINALAHASAGLLMFLIARCLWPGKTGTYAGMITASLFIAFPSALNWYAQIHKDGFAIMGMLLIFYSWIQVIETPSRFRMWSWLILGNIIGMALVVFVRPYNIMLLAFSAAVIYALLLLYFVTRRKVKKVIYFTLFLGGFIVSLSVLNSYMPKMLLIEQKEVLLDVMEKQQGISWRWEKSKIVPSSVDTIVENASYLRVVSIYYGRAVKAKSLVDEHVRPNNIWSSVAYLPRAAFIALFAPFPKTWSENLSIIHLVSIGETTIWYMIVPGIFFAFWYRRSVPLFLFLVNAIVFLTILGYTNPNIGTLYRFRYLYIFILMLVGIMGWIELIRRKYGSAFLKNAESGKTENVPPSTDTVNEDNLEGSNGRSTVISAGITVIVFTFLSNVFLVGRDVMLARWFGLSNELDAFFIAMIIPMFLVTVLSIPMGTVIIPPLIKLFSQAGRKEAQRFITGTSTVLFYGMLAVTALLYISGKLYLPVLAWGFQDEKIILLQRIFIIVLPILFCSGFVILGNSILNARQKFALPAMAQAIVPIIAIAFLLLTAGKIGIYAMATGMFVGQIANLLIVVYYVRKDGYSIIPDLRRSFFRDLRTDISFKRLFGQYTPLVLAAAFLSLALPVNNMIAATLPPGSVAAYNVGSKFVLFFTGLVGTGISTVLLPHFSHYFAGNRQAAVKKELSFFLVLATAIPIPATVILFILTPFMVQLIFQGGIFSGEDIATVTKIMRYGIIQISFFCTNMILVKFANAKRKNTLVTISSFFGLVVNVIFSLIFIRHMGVAGIALASSLAMLLATMLLVVVGYKYGDINQRDITFISVTWMLLLIMFLYYYYCNMMGVSLTVIPLIVAMISYFRQVIHEKREYMSFDVVEKTS